MPHRFTNLQNEFGKPVIAAGIKRPENTDYVDISWLDTTDDITIEEIDQIEEDKVVLSQTLAHAISDMGEVALKIATKDAVVTNGVVTLGAGETFISCTVQFDTDYEPCLPSISITGDTTTLIFGTDCNNKNVKVITATSILTKQA